jgi:hypothetical protein
LPNPCHHQDYDRSMSYPAQYETLHEENAWNKVRKMGLQGVTDDTYNRDD